MSDYQPTERRPIASRRWPIWQRLVTWLVACGVSANAISVAGMVAGGLAGAALAATPWIIGYERLAFLAGAMFIQLRLLSNLLDGMVAIESRTASPVGELYNEVPDRVSDTAILVGGGAAIGGDLAFGLIAACLAMFTAYIRAMGKAAGAPQEFCGPMAKQQRMALMTGVSLYCGLTPTDWQPAFNSRGPVAFVLVVIAIGSLATAIRRLGRIAGNLKKPRSEEAAP